MHTGWLVVVAAAAACVPVPPFQGSAQPALLTVDRQTGKVASTISAPVLYVVEFAAAGVRGPERITVEGADILKEGLCPFEGGVGITLYPALSAAAPALGGSDGTSTLAVEWAGPVVARVALTWRSPYTCNGASQEASGTSTFTMFPNGRIVRHDAVTPSTTALTIDGAACGCSTDDNFNFSSFWAFKPTAQTVEPDGSSWSDGETNLGCAVYPGHTIGVGFSEASHSRMYPGEGAAAFVYDWERQARTLDPSERTTTSAILLSKETQAARCGEVTADLADPPITIGRTAGISSDDNGIYPGPARQSERYEISSPARLPRGFVVSLDLAAVPVVERTPAASGDWYAVQPQDGRMLLWFRDGLGTDERITIVPQ